MSDEPGITILKEFVKTSSEAINIDCLKYSQENPRVYSILYENNLTPQRNQDIQKDIYKMMLKQPSVKNIKQDIYDNGGLLDPILIRHDTYEVIEGNSRLTAYLYWHQKDPQDEKWQTIDCRTVDTLTDEQQDAYLNAMHIKGKTKWETYEKAHLVYRRYEAGVPMEGLKKRFSISESEINKRIAVVQMMKDNNDIKQDNFSYYDVLRRTTTIYEKLQSTPEVKTFLLKEIKENSNNFTALHLRDKLPSVLQNRKQLNKFIKGENNLDEAWQAARTNTPDSKLRLAIYKCKDVCKSDISRLDVPDLNKLVLTVKNLRKEIERIENMINEQKQVQNK